MRRAAVAVLVLAFAASSFAQERPRPDRLPAASVRPRPVWVYFKDKGPAAEAMALAAGTVNPRALARRAARGTHKGVTLEDAPMRHEYVAAVGGIAGRVRNVSRWLNAMSVEATAEQAAAIAALPFVAKVEPVRRYGQRREPLQAPLAAAAAGADEWKKALVLDYGTSLGQLEQIKVTRLHEFRLDGRGVIVAVLDSGFDTLQHEAFATTSILATRDFVNGDADVSDAGDAGEGSHGTQTLSVLAGYRPGQLIGPAYAASFLLAKTENTASETPVEEDNWAAAVEWAESLGADVVSSSLGYLVFDRPFESYTARDMDGDTAISTRAADLAAARGVVVVVSGGNAGPAAPGSNSLAAPADGHGVIAVGAVTSAGARASFSSVGPTADGRIKPDVAAQGVSVKVARPDSTSAYATANGTSFACPLVAGTAALLLQARPDATAEEIAGALRATASQGGSPDNLLGHGVVDALAALRALGDFQLP
jgi:hypothetical protein